MRWQQLIDGTILIVGIFAIMRMLQWLEKRESNETRKYHE